jgi:hypothetical protein
MVRPGSDARRDEDRARMALVAASRVISLVVLATLFLWWVGWANQNGWTVRKAEGRRPVGDVPRRGTNPDERPDPTSPPRCVRPEGDGGWAPCLAAVSASSRPQRGQLVDRTLS